MAEQDASDPSMPDPGAFVDDDDGIDDRLALRAAFSTALAQNEFPDTLVLARERAGVVFHERRLELLDYLRANEPDSVRALADALGHDKGVVSRDLRQLAGVDVVEYVDDGRAKAPRLKHRHVAVEPVV